LLNLFVADVVMQVGWQTVPYTRTRRIKAYIAETVVCSWYDACPSGMRSWSKQMTTTVGE